MVDYMNPGEVSDEEVVGRLATAGIAIHQKGKELETDIGVRNGRQVLQMADRKGNIEDIAEVCENMRRLFEIVGAIRTLSGHPDETKRIFEEAIAKVKDLQAEMRKELVDAMLAEDNGALLIAQANRLHDFQNDGPLRRSQNMLSILESAVEFNQNAIYSAAIPMIQTTLMRDKKEWVEPEKKKKGA